MQNPLLQQVLKKQANSWTHEESGIVFHMVPLFTLRMQLIREALIELGIDIHDVSRQEGTVANIFLMLEGFCVGIDFPQEIDQNFEALRAYWNERLPFTYGERFEAFCLLIDEVTNGVIHQAYVHTRDGGLVAPQDLQSKPPQNDPELESAS